MEDQPPLDVIRIWTEDIRIALRAAGVRGFTLVNLPNTICASLGPSKQKANISWFDGGREWYVELGYSGYPIRHGVSVPKRQITFDIFTVDCDLVTSIIVRYLRGDGFEIPTSL